MYHEKSFDAAPPLYFVTVAEPISAAPSSACDSNYGSIDDMNNFQAFVNIHEE